MRCGWWSDSHRKAGRDGAGRSERRAASNAALGRSEEARAAVAAALARHPDLSIQGFLSSPTGEADRKLMEGLMREAGFPVCAKPEELAKFEKPLRLPECPLPEAPN